MGCLFSKEKIIYIWEDIEITRLNIKNMFYPTDDGSESEPDIRNFKYYYGDEFELR